MKNWKRGRKGKAGKLAENADVRTAPTHLLNGWARRDFSISHQCREYEAASYMSPLPALSPCPRLIFPKGTSAFVKMLLKTFPGFFSII